MAAITLLTLAGINGRRKMAAKKKKKKGGKKGGKKSARRNPASIGKRYTKSVKGSGRDLLTIAGMIGGNITAQMVRSQLIARLPVGNIAGHAADVAANWLGVAPLLEAIIPGEFGRGLALGVRFNSAIAAVGSFTQPGSLARGALTVSPFLPPAPVQLPTNGNDAVGAPMLPGYEYDNPALGTVAMPGSKYDSGMRRVA